ncbi:MarR family winged helix-turn-helix transcriptional regulator [Pseudidiomarina sediminum]|uniref:MarR family winged helix-turn-helix transcriptional regulator n=1 Tax=Pseudidiomarina sediminum TaxID=431675 RepID=UPI001C9851BC|nr:MarR family transcriptional regulator [Pseudidiomarina sediminum]MBY6064116.1 MarR family transcriptional regulator [Pseudidiomarina sediminum]
MIRSPQFGAILMRSAELIAIQGQQVFDALAIGLPANRISILLALYTQGPLSSTELAKHIGLSRQLIESRLKGSVKDGFFASQPDARDSRKRVYVITPQAMPEAEKIVAIMQDFEQVYATLWQEIGVDIEQALQAMEKGLAKRSLVHRLYDHSPHLEP